MAAQRERQFNELISLEKDRQQQEMAQAKALLEAALAAKERALHEGELDERKDQRVVHAVAHMRPRRFAASPML